MDLVKLINLVAVVVLSSVATIVGIQIIFLLRDLRRSFNKINSTIDTAHEAVLKFSQPVANLTSLMEGLRQSSKVVDMFSGLWRKSDTKVPPPLS